MSKPLALLFDVNETLLDMAGLDPALTEALGSPSLRGEWFARLLHTSVVANYTGGYRSFGAIGVDTLVYMASRRGLVLSDGAAKEIVAKMLSLPPHSEVPGALRRLQAAGFRMATLTNSSNEAVATQMRNAGLDNLFDRMISVEEVRLFKPAPQVYQRAAQLLEIDLGGGLLIAAHDWDILGARVVGMPGGYLARPGSVWTLPEPPPSLVAPDLDALADLLIG